MAKKDPIKRDKISYDSELRRWFGIRLDSEYRRFFLKYARKYLVRRNTTNGKLWLLKATVSASEDLYKEHNEACQFCSNKWGLIRPIDYREVKPKGRIFRSGAAHLAHPFLAINGPVVSFQIDLSYANNEIIQAFSAELTQLRNAVNAQNKFGFKKIADGKYSKIGYQRNKPSISKLELWSEIYELRRFYQKKLSHNQIADRLAKKYAHIKFDEKKMEAAV